MKKKLLRAFLIILLLLPVLAFAHFLAFPQEKRCILIRFADFKKQDNIYFRKNAAPEKLNRLEDLKTIAERKLDSLWADKRILNYSIIYCNNEKDYNNYGVAGTPAATQLKMGAYVVLQDESLDSNIIAHEIAHTVLYNNIGWHRTRLKIPKWFDEGLSMQVDGRDYYSEDSLLQKRNTGVNIPDASYFSSHDFYEGDRENIMLHFMAAKHIVHEWLKQHSLQKFVERLNNGSSFEKAYSASD